MAEFAAMTLKELKKQALAAGIGQEQVEDVDGAQDPRSAVIQLIQQKMKATPQVSRAQLMDKTLREVKKIARDNGIGEEDIENCDENENPKEAVTALILAKQAAPAPAPISAPLAAPGPVRQAAGYPQPPQQRVPYTARAQQSENFPEVAMKMPKNDQIVAKVPNGELLTVEEVDGDGKNSQGRVKWKETEGWVKLCNVIPVEPVAEAARGGVGPHDGANMTGPHHGANITGPHHGGRQDQRGTQAAAQQAPCIAVAKQFDDFPDVVLKDDAGGVVHKVANLDTVKLIRQGENDAFVRWSDRIDGWAKPQNLQVDITIHRNIDGGRTFKITVKLSENADDIKRKVAEHEHLEVQRVQLYYDSQPIGPDHKPGWIIKHGDRLEMRDEQAPPAPSAMPTPGQPAVRFSGHPRSNIKCFVSGQITRDVENTLETLGADRSVKASMPAFNRPRGGIYPPGMENIDIPCYGPDLTEAIMKLFQVDKVVQTARALRFMLPQCSINEVITAKNIERGPLLVEAVRTAGGDPTSVERLSTFVQKISDLKLEDFLVNGKPRSNGSWVDNYVVDKDHWRSKLHVNVCLTNFGFSEDFCARFKDMIVPGKADKWSDWAVRWLAKAFDVFSYQGSPSDVVNLIYAMLGKPHESQPNIVQVVDAVKEFTQVLQSGDWAKIVWKPNYMIQDSELDDMLAWLLCRTICSSTSSTFECHVQLPPVTQPNGRGEVVPTHIDYLQAQYEARSTRENIVTVFRDPDSRNFDKVEYSACFVPPQTVFLASHTEMRAFVGEYKWSVSENMFTRGSARLYLHSFTGCWCVSLDVAGMQHDYYQIKANKKGCLPHTNLGWSMLVRPENRPRNTEGNAVVRWNQPDSNRHATWQKLDAEGAPILPHGQVYEGPRPTFMFLISRTPLRRAESPPRCLWVNPAEPNRGAPCTCDNGQRALSQAIVDGYTLCEEHKKRGRQRLNCPVYVKARAFLYELGVTEFLDHSWDHCYCPDCYKPHQDDIIAPTWTSWLIAPRGWVGFGIIVPSYTPAGVGDGVSYNQMGQWPTTFHGTRPSLLPYILRHGQIGTPGDRLPDNSVLKSLHCAGRQDTGIFYTSPTIEYAGNQFYARPRRSSTMPGIVGQVVLQCNQNRDEGNVLREQGEVMALRANGFDNHGVCKYTPLFDACHCANCALVHQHLQPHQRHRVDIVSTKPELCVIRRVLVRIFEENNPPTRDRARHDIKVGHGHELQPIPGEKENFRSPVDLRPCLDGGDGCIWL